ncbi:MAG: amidohydrolase family protein [Gammaproteobacteria bacterium]|nr:amidohydrolase family protein [Gammaproteobacteria bacterium]
MKRRRLIKGLIGLGVVGGVGYWQASRHWDGFVSNPCKLGLPEPLKNSELWQTIWQGIDSSKVMDCHVHTVGLGDANSGIWVNPQMQSWRHPIQHAQFKFYMNAACIKQPEQADSEYVAQLMALQSDMPVGFKSMLFAFDYHHNDKGQAVKELSTFYVPNEYPAKLAQQNPDKFEWAASIHPYRADAIDALEQAKTQGAVGVKWLPPAQNMDPMSARCDAFYRKLEELDMALICHAGTEKAVKGSDTQELGNPLRLRRALDQGVKVVVAHCATLGENEDLDKTSKPMTDSFELFKRLMSEYQENLYGELSATLQINRSPEKLKYLIENQEWHSRLVNGSDYPLPAVMPLISLKRLIRANLLDEKWQADLNLLRQHNGLAFDFAVKRLLQSNGQQFSTQIFETQNVFK